MCNPTMVSSTATSCLPTIPPLDEAPSTRGRQGKQTIPNIRLKPRPRMKSVHHTTHAPPSPNGPEAEDFSRQLSRLDMSSEQHIFSTPTASNNNRIAGTSDASNVPFPSFPALLIPVDAIDRARPIVTLAPRYSFHSPTVVDSADSIVIHVAEEQIHPHTLTNPSVPTYRSQLQERREL